jgi:hypothetical protein
MTLKIRPGAKKPKTGVILTEVWCLFGFRSPTAGIVKDIRLQEGNIHARSIPKRIA